MDDVDRRILNVLQSSADLSLVALADRVGASSASCWRRIKALEAAGILKQCVRLVEPRAVGRDVNVICHVRLKAHADEAGAGFERFLAERSEIMECYAMSGEWDYLLRVVVRDVADYENFLMRTLLKQPAVATAASYFALKQVKYTTAIPV